ncbi:MAG: hypothetical protein ABH864_04855 [archaeon]
MTKKETEPKDVVISSQTFRDAGGDLERPRLKLGGFILGAGSKGVSSDDSLRDQARARDYTHIYNFHEVNRSAGIIGGDGYYPIEGEEENDKNNNNE